MSDYVFIGIILSLFFINQVIRFVELRQEKRRINILMDTFDLLTLMHNSEKEKGNEMLKLIVKLQGKDIEYE